MSRRGSLVTAGAASAALLLCAAAPVDRERALSPDGRWVAVVETVGAIDSSDPETQTSTLWLEPRRGGQRRLLLRPSAPYQPPQQALHAFGQPVWSLDGGSIYVVAAAWTTSGAVHQIDVHTGKERFIAPGNSLAVIRDGPYRGMLLLNQHRYHPAPAYGSYDPTYVVRPDGKSVLMVPGSDEDEGDPSVARWLKAHGWTAR